MATITVFLAKDELDGEMSFFAFEHKTGSHWHAYTHYTVISIEAFEGDSLTDKLSYFVEAVKASGGCEWKEDHEVMRMFEMVNPVRLESFGLDADVTIKVRKSGELLPGMRVLTGYSGRKVWRTVSKIRQRSATCYSVFFEDGWNETAGSCVKYLTK
ncbi:hypothetical protein H1N98_gp28 [Escherichia phage vB_EcoS-DELF2]|uniref:Uncharacterized protein n=1 Tax=Escherichia phage vB_EcoS-DELF2 TaxID=2697005 RepID=A0A679F7M0_9CAUD|nr:hypothetical protein H1N98_gp28 [Escherichia phage vB_EcoS-DELF2]BBU41799.1 hypothetical protein [Escherichia phage vB_EcoS-DELF2]